jgi:asparagine synthase (glutamine-hydrolysing)
MCGIAGVVDSETALIGRDQLDVVRRMCDAMYHRGPDDAGYGHGDGFVLGMRRLSIIDVSLGQQPVRDESGRLTAVFNGEFCNFLDLQAGLRSNGHRLASASDSECLPRLYEVCGKDMVDHSRCDPPPRKVTLPFVGFRLHDRRRMQSWDDDHTSPPRRSAMRCSEC